MYAGVSIDPHVWPSNMRTEVDIAVMVALLASKRLLSSVSLTVFKDTQHKRICQEHFLLAPFCAFIPSHNA